MELFNFKSYRGHHTLLFGDSYFTSIIGPNGSGKSNSMDAISFVLGIKSSHLRSAHLRDLVYRGRVLRKSRVNGDGSATALVENGLANGDAQQGEGDEVDVDGGVSQATGTQMERNDPKTASVMAVYEDDAGEEQRWKRSITAQGASEYRINNRVVTAQQYNQALEAENILIKARNFLVFQGDVEAIASQSPKDLTRLIEQISGSLDCKAEYERLREAAEQATENQNDHLNRRRAINSEVKQYQEQKREAESYAKKAKERDQAIVTHVLWKLFRFQQVMDQSSVEIQRHQEELKELERGLESYESRLEDARKDQARPAREVTKVERGMKERQKEIEEQENGLVPVDEKIAITERSVKSYSAKIVEISREEDAQSSIVNRLGKDLDLVGKAQAKWEADWQKAARSEGRALGDGDLQEYKRLRERVHAASSADEGKVDTLARQLKTEEETVSSLRGRLDSAQWQVQKLDEEIKELSGRRDLTRDRVKNAVDEINAKKKELNALTSERLRTARMQTELDEKLQDTLKGLLEADDGRRQSERERRIRETVAGLKRIYPGVRGRLGELCRPKQKKYGDAVSTVLGRHFDSIVVDTEKTAKDCIQYLRDQRAGQATFIPLDSIQVKTPNTNLKGMHARMRMAIDTIEYDSAFERAMLYACGNAVVCDDLSVAKYICYERGVEAKAVTLEGTVIHKGGLITGGRGPGQQNSRRWGDAEVEDLQRIRDDLLAQLAALPKDGKRRVAEETLQGELTGLEQSVAYGKEELKGFERNIESKKKELTFGKRQLAEAQEKFEEKHQRVLRLRAEVDEIQEAVRTVEDEVFVDFCRRLGYKDIREYEVQQGSREQDAAQRRLEFTMQRSKLESQSSFERQRLQSTQDRIRRLKEKSESDESLLAELQAEKERIEVELQSTSEELDELKGRLDEANERHATKAEKVAERRREVQRRRQELEGVQRTVAGLEAEVQRNAAGRYGLLRRCKLEDVRVPLARGSASLEAIPVDEALQADPDAMEIDDDPEAEAVLEQNLSDFGVRVNFDGLDDELKEDSSNDKLDAELQERISTLAAELDKMAPNARAMERLEGVENKLRATEKEFDRARREAKRARDDFQDVKDKRFDLFNRAFTHISEQIAPVYKDLTKSAQMPLGGQAYLDIEDTDEPYLEGIKYHAMPPLKRFRDMENLSGGEKTMAALALLFAVHSYQPSPFFVLDEVDAALDNANVARIAGYIRRHAGPGMQFVVISLKTGLFQNSDALVGIYRDQTANSSKALTLDLRKYQ